MASGLVGCGGATSIGAATTADAAGKPEANGAGDTNKAAASNDADASDGPDCFEQREGCRCTGESIRTCPANDDPATCNIWCRGGDIMACLNGRWAFGGFDGPCAAHPAPRPEDAGEAEADAGDASCHEPLDASQPFGPCPTTFDDSSWKTKSICALYPAMQASEQTCDGYRSRLIPLSTHAWTCYYDPTALTLVAAHFQDDIPDIGDRGNCYEVTLGEIPSPGTCSPPVNVGMPWCDSPEAGTGDASAE